MIESVDVSWPQGNYQPGAEAGVFVAATSGDGGTNFVQDTLAEDVANARAAGKEVAFYHFNGPESLDPVASARFFWAAIRPYFQDGDLAALDVESSSGGKVPHVSPGWALAFDTELARLRGLSTQEARTGTYGNRSDMRQPGWGAVEASGSWLWLAAPGGYPENTPVGEWSHWTMLQYSSAGGIDHDQSQLSFSQIAGATTRTDDDDMLSTDSQTFLNNLADDIKSAIRREARGRLYYCATPPAGLPQFVCIFWERDPKDGANILYATGETQADHWNTLYSQTSDSVAQAKAAALTPAQFQTMVNLALGTDSAFTNPLTPAAK